MLHKGQHRKGPRAFPGRHAEVFGLKGEGQSQLVLIEIALEDIHYGFTKPQMRQGSNHFLGKVTAQGGVIFLEAGIHLVVSHLLLFQKPIEPLFVSWKDTGNLFPHGGVVGRRFDRGLVKGQPIHGLELDEVQIIVAGSSSLLENLIQNEFHHQEGRTGIKLVAVQIDCRVAATQRTVFFHQGHPKATSPQ